MTYAVNRILPPALRWQCSCLAKRFDYLSRFIEKLNLTSQNGITTMRLNFSAYGYEKRKRDKSFSKIGAQAKRIKKR